ncbi:MAG: PH domain-containing protein [Lachnospiraceae bacterium]|nr:PH domain-containing protein [Lachnospiraceae bacterium]
MINFNDGSVFNLHPIELENVKKEVEALFVDGEKALAAFKTIRDQLIFTNKRIIAIDVQGVTGKGKSFTSMPYANIQYFAVQTQGFIEIFPDTELFLTFNNGFTAKFEFKGNFDIAALGRIISQYVLTK